MEPIAIIGIGCCFPGADSPEAYWNLIKEGQDAITDVPKNRWPNEDYYDANKIPGKTYVKKGGFIDHVDTFDAAFFGISPREALQLDPQQRLLLETTWHALEDAQINPHSLENSLTGVFIGICNADYLRLHARGYAKDFDAYSGTGMAFSIAANRISYYFNLHGPSIAIDTACSSSLTALHMACQSLRLEESTLAIAGGVNVMLSPDVNIIFSQANMMSPDGLCKTFDAKANGYVRGEGCGIVILKRLKDALKEGDPIRAVIRGSAINQDGLTNGLTAPNGPAQQALMRAALKQANVLPEDITYLEAHGTGTSLGDPIEIKAAIAVLSDNRSVAQPCYIGSVKTNIGHLEAAAGIAGLIKVILALEEKIIPPHLHLTQLNPLIKLPSSLFFIPTQATLWSDKKSKRLAGVSSFGFGGTNVHVILEEAPVLPSLEKTSVQKPLHILTISAKSQSALLRLIEAYLQYIEKNKTIDLAKLCISSQTKRAHLSHRFSVATHTKEELKDALNKAWNKERVKKSPYGVDTPPIVLQPLHVTFLFTGQGSQYVNMGRVLYETEPVFRDTLNLCNNLLSHDLSAPLLNMLYPSSEQSVDPSCMDQTGYTQLVIFSLEVALAYFWKSIGIQPNMVLGHSVGEIAAAHIAGIFDLKDAITLVATRARLMQSLPSGAGMLSVFASLEKIDTLLATLPMNASVDATLVIAVNNGLHHIVLSGLNSSLDELSIHLQALNIHYKKLSASHAFHSPFMTPILDKFSEEISQLTFHTPNIPIISNQTGLVATDEMSTPDYWVQHILRPVKFYESICTLFDLTTHQSPVLLEIGPKSTLLGLAHDTWSKQYVTQHPHVYFLPSLREGGNGQSVTIKTLTQLYTAGVDIDWLAYNQGESVTYPLPLYPFETTQYWLRSFAYPSEAEYTHIKTAAMTEAHKVNAISTKDNLYYRVQWEALSRIDLDTHTTHLSDTRPWLLLVPDVAFGQALQETFYQAYSTYYTTDLPTFILITLGSSYHAFSHTHYQIRVDEYHDFELLLEACMQSTQSKPQGCIHALGCTLMAAENIDAVQYNTRMLSSSALYICQALISKNIPMPIWFITKGGQCTKEESLGEKGEYGLVPESAWLWGFARSARIEHPELACRMIDIDPSVDFTQPASFASALKQITTSLFIPIETELAWRNGLIYAPRLMHASLVHTVDTQPLIIKNDATYWITGGLGGIGLTIAESLVQNGARHIILSGRKHPNDSAQAKINHLKKQGASIHLYFFDIGNETAFLTALNEIKSQVYPLKGIIHAAGIQDDASLMQLDKKRCESVRSPKMDGAWLLHHHTHHMALDFLVYFSSISAILGSTHLAHYSAANAYLDMLAHSYSQPSPSHTKRNISMSWGPWSEVGMTAKRLDTLSQSNLEKIGMHLLSPQKGVVAWWYALSQKENYIIAEIDWPQYYQMAPGIKNNPIMFALFNQHMDASKVSSLLQHIKTIPLAELENVFLDFIQGLIAQTLHIPVHQLDTQEVLQRLGLDSLMAMEIRNKIAKELEIQLPIALLMEDITPLKLAAYLYEQWIKQKNASTQTAKENIPPPTLSLGIDVEEGEV